VGVLLHPATPNVSAMDAAATLRKDILLMLIEDSLRQANMQDFRTKFLTISKLIFVRVFPLL
jgi:hypothetical protein